MACSNQLSRAFRRSVLVPVVAVAIAGGAAGAATAAAKTATDVSSNWSGYVVAGTDASTGGAKSFSSVSGTWVQPAADCTTSTAGSTASAFWVGLGGDSTTSSSLEQTGTEADCTVNGTARYSAWYELVGRVGPGQPEGSGRRHDLGSCGRRRDEGVDPAEERDHGRELLEDARDGLAGCLLGRVDRRGAVALHLDRSVPADRVDELRDGQVLERLGHEQRPHRHDLGLGLDGDRDPARRAGRAGRVRPLRNAGDGRGGGADGATEQGRRVLRQVAGRELSRRFGSVGPGWVRPGVRLLTPRL